MGRWKEGEKKVVLVRAGREGTKWGWRGLTWGRCRQV